MSFSREAEADALIAHLRARILVLEEALIQTKAAMSAASEFAAVALDGDEAHDAKKFVPNPAIVESFEAVRKEMASRSFADSYSISETAAEKRVRLARKAWRERLRMKQEGVKVALTLVKE